MTFDQILILAILAATIAMFFWGRWRHDMVAMAALLACVLAGLTPIEDAFTGFGHPAVITVACVLVLSAGLQRSGAVNALTRYVIRDDAGPMQSMAALVGLGALLSGFMNNVGAMALLMPLALQLARRLEMPPGRILMPLAFGTILGGMTTLIGTPPNIIVAGFRSRTGEPPFGMFDFTPVGLVVALAGLVFIIVVGWRLVPNRSESSAGSFDTNAYITEVRVPTDAKLVGKRLGEIEADVEDMQILGLVRNEMRLVAPHQNRVIQAEDILVIEVEAEALSDVLSRLGLPLEESKENTEAKAENGKDNDDTAEGDETDQADQTAQVDQTDAAPSRRTDRPLESGREDSSTLAASPPDQTGPTRRTQPEADHNPGEVEEETEDADKEEDDDRPAASEEIVLTELAVMPRSPLVGRSATDIQVRTRYGINMLAVSREGDRAVTRLRTMRLQAGDLLLMQGTSDVVHEFASDFGCVPLAERSLNIPDRSMAIKASVIMVLAIGLAAVGWLPAAIAFALGVLASMALQTVPLRAVYDAIDWPVIVLLAALIPVAGAMEATGTADWIARSLMDHLVQGNGVLALAIVLVVTMLLSDVMNNAATAAVMAPIAISTAGQLEASADPFLMAVAIGASCAFLTPIGHQNNTLILGPGGFRFGDYWQLGIPLEILVTVISIPMLLWIWPL